MKPASGTASPRRKTRPAEIVDKLNKEINAAIADPGMKARLAAIGGEPMPGSPADFGKLIADETEKWGKVVRAAGLKPEYMRLRLAREGHILRAERKPAEPGLERTQPREAAREKQIVLNAGRRPSRGTQSLRQTARKNQFGVLVERTRIHRMNRQRVQRIMLEDRDQATRSRDPVQLLQPRHMLLVGDVMEHAGRECDIERAGFAGDAAVLDQNIVAVAGVTLFAQREAALRDV